MLDVQQYSCDLGQKLDHLNCVCHPNSKGHSHSAGNLWLQRTALWEKGNRVDRPILDKMSLSAGHNDTDAHGLLSLNADPSAKTVYSMLCLHHQCLLFHADLLLGCHFFVGLFTQWFCNGANIWQRSTQVMFWGDLHVPSNTKDLTLCMLVQR